MVEDKEAALPPPPSLLDGSRRRARERSHPCAEKEREERRGRSDQEHLIASCDACDEENLILIKSVLIPFDNHDHGHTLIDTQRNF